MTNKQYFIHLQFHPVKLGDFEVSVWALNSFLIPKLPDNAYFRVDIRYNGKLLPLRVRVYLSKRSIITDIDYSFTERCKISPYELREWCPAIFLPFTNYLHWQKFLRIALEIYVETNPKLL